MDTAQNKWTNRYWATAVGGILLVGICGCQQRMADQPSFKTLTPCDYFTDGSSARPFVEGTVARGLLRTDTALFTGRKHRRTEPPAVKEAPHAAAGPNSKALDQENDFVDTFPIPVDQSTVEHGHHRYMIYCVVCHDPLGTGEGKIVERGYTRPPSYHIDRLRTAPVGRLFAVISEGYGSMPSYGGQIPPEDRWAIVSYIKALQLSQHYPESELTEAMKAHLPPVQAAASGNQSAAPVEGGRP